MRLRVYNEDGDENGRRDDLIADVVAVLDPVGGRWALKIVEGSLLHESEMLLDRTAAEAEAYADRGTEEDMAPGRGT